MSTESCPRCGRPIPDTAYVCTDCQRELASKLHRAAGLWEHVQDTVGYLVAVENGTRPSRAARRDVVGPICEGRRCDHETCVAIWKTETRTRHTEPPGVREEKGLLDLDAFENSWIVRNTVDAWTSHVEQHRGNRPAPKPKRAIVGAQTLTVIHDDARPDLCTLSDLPFEQCAAHPGRPHQAAS